MPLETATYISDLVTSNPAGSDGMNNADDHLRLIKAVVKTTFPSITGAVTATHTQLNTAASNAVSGNPILPDAGVFFKTNSTDGFTNPVAGEIDFKLSGALAAQFMRSSSINTFHWYGPATFDGAVTAPGIVPIGGMIMWLDDALPDVGTWCWANGGTLSRTGNGALLYAVWSRNGANPLRYGAGDGSTTFNVINMQEAVPVGKSTMGGATSPGLLPSVASDVKSLLAGLFGTDTVTLLLSALPNYAPGFSGLQQAWNSNNSNVNLGGALTGGVSSGGGSLAGYAGGASPTQTTISVTVTPNGTVGSINGNQAQTAVNILQPSRVVNYIIRIG